MAEAALDTGALDIDRMVRGAMPQAVIDRPKIEKGLTEAAEGEAKEKGKIAESMKRQSQYDVTEVHRKYEGIEPADVKPWDAKAAKKEFSTDPIEAFGSVGFIAAQLASAFTRQPMVNALNAGGAAIQAMNEKNDKDYDRAFSAWKENTNLAIKRHDMQRQSYDDAIKLMNTDHKAGSVQMELAALKYGDLRRLALIRGRHFEELAKLDTADQQAFRQLAQVAPQLEVGNQKKRAADEMRKSGASEKEIFREIYAPATMSRMTLDSQRRQNIYQSVIDDYKKHHDIENDEDVPSDVKVRAQMRAFAKGGSQINAEQAGLAAERVIVGDPKATTGFARSPEAMAEIQSQLVNKLGSDRAAAEAIRINNMRYAADLSGSRELGKRDAFLTLAENEAKSLLPRVREASNKIDRTEFPNINSLILAAQRGTGGEDVIKLGIAVQSLIPVYARVLKPTGVLTEGDFKRAEHIIDERWSKGQIGAALDQMTLEMNAARKGLEMTREEFPRPHSAKETPKVEAPVGPPKSMLPQIQDRVVGQEYNFNGRSVFWGEDGRWYSPKEWFSRTGR